MLNASLPFKVPQQENPQNPQSNNILPDANLLGKREFFKKEKEVRQMIVRTFQGTIFLLCTITLILLAVNQYYSSKLAPLVAEKDRLYNDLATKQEDIALARKFESQVNTYKNIIGQRKRLAVPIEKVFMGVEDPVELLALRTTQVGFTLSVRSDTPGGVVQMLYDLLNNGEISTVSLKSVTLDPDTGIYRVTLDGVYK